MAAVLDRENTLVLIGKGPHQSHVYVVCCLNSGSNDEAIKSRRHHPRKLKIAIKYLFTPPLNPLEDLWIHIFFTYSCTQI